MDGVFEAMLSYHITIPTASVALSQSGDHIGGSGLLTEDGYKGGQGNPKLRRKCMNSFICSTDRQFKFFGRINEDVNTYLTLSRRGVLFFTATQIRLNQLQTQSNAGGMSELYLDSGTYLKTFYSVMYAPSCVKVGQMGDPRSPHYRIHHKINWHHTAPKILREEWRRGNNSLQSSSSCA